MAPRRSQELWGLLPLLAPFTARTDGCAWRSHVRRDGVAPHRSSRMWGLVTLLSPPARTGGSTTRDRIQQDGMALPRA